MKTNRLAISAGTAALALAGMIACSPDTTTAPPRAAVKVPAVFNLEGSDPGRGEMIICKTGSAATFSVVFSGNFIAAEVQNLTFVSGQTYTLSLNAAQCKVIYSRLAGGPQVNQEAFATVTENPTPGFTLSNITAATETDEAVTTDVPNRRATVAANMFHDAVVTFVNTPIVNPPTAVCDFSTFGGFTLEKNFNISYGGNAGFAKDAFAYGDLNFKNHTTGDHLHVWNVTGYVH